MAVNVPRLALIGGTGAAGEQVLAALDASELGVGALEVYASSARSPSVDSVTFRGAPVGVRPIAALSDARPDLAILCVPSAVSRKVGPTLIARGTFVVDVGNSTSGTIDAPLVLPALGKGLPEAAARAGAVRTPSSVGALVAALAAPLAPLGLTGVSGVVSVSASSRGRAGMEELGQQVVATLNNQDPTRRLFPDGLAFDTLAEDTGADEWSAGEQLAAVEVADLVGLAANRVAVQVATQPLFSGVTAGLHLRGVRLEDAEVALSSSAAVGPIPRASRLRPRVLTGKAGVGWGRLRQDPAGDGVFLWAVTDDLATAGAAVSAVVGWVSAAGLLGGE